MRFDDFEYCEFMTKNQDISLSKPSVLLRSSRDEDRANYVSNCVIGDKGILDVCIEHEVGSSIDDVVIAVLGEQRRFKLNIKERWFDDLIASTDIVYLDITSLNGRVLAYLLVKINQYHPSKRIYAIYIEPENYDILGYNSRGIESTLSEEFMGIDPLPGLSSITPDEGRGVVLVALLGFEGLRLSYIIENIYTPKSIIPILGYPGYRPEYPFHSLWCNKDPINETNCGRHLKFALANSPISLINTLIKIKEKYRPDKIKIALTGTKPHFLGALIYAITNPDHTELVYDNPSRKEKRSIGVGCKVVCDVSKIFHEMNK